MAMRPMRTASPWWLSLVFGVGLLWVFLGERLLNTMPSVRVAMTGMGLALVFAVTAGRAWTTTSTKGARRRVERALLLCHVGTILALVLYALTTSWGPDSLHTPKAEGALTVLWGVLLVASTIPVLMIELSLGAALRTGFDIESSQVDDSGVEYYRVRDLGWAGLSIAFAMAFLMVTCRVAKDRNIQADVSYFKTSAAGESTQNIVHASADPIRVMMFFPPGNEVKEHILSYFEALASDSGKLEVTVHDRLSDAELAGKYKVTKDGVIVLARGKDDKEKYFTIEVTELDIEKARKGSKLRTFDKDVNSTLMKLVRDKRKAYMMTGHGEMNDPESIPPELKGRAPERRTSKLKQRLSELNYEIKDLGLIDLAKDVPEDATIVLLLAPTVPLQAAEWAALDRYLERGGRLLVALDPKADPNLGVLEGRLGLKMNPGDLTDDVAFLPQRGTQADRRFAITTQFSAHASTTTLSRAVDKGLVLIDAGALEDVPFASKDKAPTKTITLRSMESSYLDLNNNYAFDEGTEKKQRWNIGAAVEGPKAGDKEGFRALVYSDADLFADALVQNAMRQASVVMVSGPLLDDSVRWLGGEEQFAGEIVSEEDKPIEHTKSQDAVWFTLMIVGAPALVFTLGFLGTVYAKRRRTTKKTEVKP
ncbi:MAG: ABC-type uncharacterized transport system [Deltaproteobacteria bacterium]|nr:ABC-type uncharacterized transport system [Deltaproteobacteria bacterium]